MTLSQLTLSCPSPRLPLELPVPDSRPGPTPSLQWLFQSCDPALVNISVEEPGICCKLDSELLWSCCCHRRKIRGREKAEGSTRESVFWALCFLWQERPIWPAGRMLKHSCAVSYNLAPAAALSLPASITQRAQAPGYIWHQLLFQLSNTQTLSC